jgi:hypothetical protein
MTATATGVLPPAQDLEESGEIDTSMELSDGGEAEEFFTPEVRSARPIHIWLIHAYVLHNRVHPHTCAVRHA